MSLTTRLYQSEQDLAAMRRLLMVGRSRAGEWRYPHVGDLMWNFFMVLCHQDPCRCIRLWHDAAGQLVAYAVLGEDPSFDCQVLAPAGGEVEAAGIEEAALGWVEDEASRQGLTGELVSGARRDDARRIAFLEAHGFRYRGLFSEVNMIRALDRPLPSPELPPGYVVRPVAAEGEEEDRADAEREVWAPWPVANITGQDYVKLMHLPGYDRELDLVAVAEDGAIANRIITKGIIAAYSNCWVDAVNRIGDFGPVGARPAFRRKGLTRAVLLEGMRRMQARGMNRACVSTTESNEPARRLYESLGFRVVNEYLDYVR